MVSWPIWLKNSIYFLWNLLIFSLRLTLGFRLFLALVHQQMCACSQKLDMIRLPFNPQPHPSKTQWDFLLWEWPHPYIRHPVHLRNTISLRSTGHRIIHKANPWFCGFSPIFFLRAFAPLILLDPTGTRRWGKQHCIPTHQVLEQSEEITQLQEGTTKNWIPLQGVCWDAQEAASLRPSLPKPRLSCFSQPFNGLWFRHSVWQITSVPVAPRMVISFSLPQRQGLKPWSPECPAKRLLPSGRQDQGEVRLIALSFSLYVVFPSSLCFTHVPRPTSNSCPWQPFLTTTSNSGVIGSILCPHSHIWVWKTIVIVYNSSCVLCPFMSICFTIYSLSIETMYPPVAQEFYTTSSDNKNKIEDDKFSMDLGDNFLHLLTIRSNLCP